MGETEILAPIYTLQGTRKHIIPTERVPAGKSSSTQKVLALWPVNQPPPNVPPQEIRP